MWSQFRLAAIEGVLLGVKWGLVVLIVLVVFSLWSGLVSDYNLTKQRALNGEAAAEKLDQLLKAQPSKPAP
jgi:hypothetical protein